jgi:histidyl-tRNA synthetase
MQDFLPPEGGRLRALYQRASELAELYGYRYVETPDVEHTELFRRTSGESSDVVSKEMYTFTDRGGRSVTLRPEGTAPVMRAYLGQLQAQPSPFKGYYLTRMFRYGRPQRGRYREHRQFGIEVFGATEPGADVEVIAVGDRFLREFGLSRFALRINSIGDGTCRPAYRELLISYLESRRGELRDEHKDRFRENPLRVLDCKDEACRAVSEGAPAIIDHLCEPCRVHFDGVLAGLKDEGIAPSITPRLVRGLDYYTRTAFEFESEVLSEAQAALFGGGRYDGLAEALGGPPVPGVGFGMGLERVLIALEDEGLPPPGEPALDAFVVAVGAGRGRAKEIERTLREAGIATAADFADRPLKAQMRAADRAAARYVVIVGDQEARAGTVTWKRLADGAQSEGGIDEAIAHIAAPGGHG